MSKSKRSSEILHWIVISDLHCGCQLGLCPPTVDLDEGGEYSHSELQKKVWGYWNDFWNRWVPLVCVDGKTGKPEKFGVIVNGDTLDGVHHSSTHQITHNLADQAKIAREVLEPIVKLCKGRFYMIRGTEAHVGASGQEEERLALELGAIPNEFGQYARYDLWKKIGNGLVHVLHHIGTTGSSAYEATAVHKELTEEFTEAARWGERPPNIIVRSHRHRMLHTHVATDEGEAVAVVTPGWQAKTPFTWRLAGARLAPPQFGGIVITQGHKELYIRTQTWTIKRSTPE